jgi:acyl-CoA synthetase (AMP-forming)/AMP-acid ligase II
LNLTIHFCCCYCYCYCCCLTDVLNVSGHRLGTAEIESALVSHPSCAEAAVIGIPHPIKGQAILAYCCLKENVHDSPHKLIENLKLQVQSHIPTNTLTPILLHSVSCNESEYQPMKSYTGRCVRKLGLLRFLIVLY